MRPPRNVVVVLSPELALSLQRLLQGGRQVPVCDRNQLFDLVALARYRAVQSEWVDEVRGE